MGPEPLRRVLIAVGVLLLAPLLAGCLEEEPQAEQDPGGNLDLPIDTPTVPSSVPTRPAPAEPPANATLLYEGFANFSSPRVDPVQVPANATLLYAYVRVDAPAAAVLLVSLHGPDGLARLECGTPGDCTAQLNATPGAWRVAFSGSADQEAEAHVRLYAVLPPPDVVPPTTPVTPVPPVTPTPPPPPFEDGPDNLYNVRYVFDGRTNRTDLFTVLPGMEVMRGAIVVADVAGSPRITVYAPFNWTPVADCTEGHCMIDVESPAPGRWLVMYAGEGQGASHVNLTLLPGPDVHRPTPLEVYQRTHAYYSHRVRDTFGEGFTVPGSYASLRLSVIDEHQSTDPATTAFVRLRGPGVPEDAGCAWPLGDRTCTVDVQRPSRGLWEIVYEGQDAGAHARVIVTLTR